MEVLVLNKNFFPIQFTSIRRAFTLLYVERAVAVDEDLRVYNFEEWLDLSQFIVDHSSGFIHTVKFKIAVPEIIALKSFDKVPRVEIKFTRKNIYEHYGYRCCYCGKKFPSKELNLEHVIPKSRGGKSTWDNVVTACIECNTKKGGRTPEESGMRLKIKPSKPVVTTLSHRLVLNTGIKIKKSWKKFIDNLYWNAELKE